MVAVGPFSIQAEPARHQPAADTGDDIEAILDINRQMEQLAMALDDLPGYLHPLLNLSAINLFITKAERLAGIAAPPARTQPSQLQVGPLLMDLRSRDVTVAGEQINLSQREFDLLSFLMRHPDEALPRDRILLEVWGESHWGNRNLVDVYIAYLRSN